ncbi:MAG: MerR family transcriptional regulator [Candidatus Heimdallarchaeota archaeon]|nr:MerR family transcriptional regulator [Candidatus Heimdallarchaeota archaeon]
MSTEITIGKFSQITRLTSRALRIYEQKGLLIPSIRDKYTGYRYYTINQIEIGIKIKMLVTIGFGLQDIISILQAAQDLQMDLLNGIFSRKLNDIRLEIHRLKKLEEIMSSTNPMELLYMKCTEPIIKKIPKLRVISKREHGSYQSTIGMLINELIGVIQKTESNVEMARINGPIMFISHDDEYKEKDADIEVAIPITGRITLDSDEYEVKNLLGHDMVSLIYTGTYEDVGIAYTKAFTYINENKFSIVGHSREIYLNDPNTVDEEELMTEIHIPVRKGA